VTDGKLVYAKYATGSIAAVDLDGKIVWARAFPYNGGDSGVVSPCLAGGKLIFTQPAKPEGRGAPPAKPDAPWRLKLAPAPIDSSDVFLYHKTTHRAAYEEARAALAGADDALLWNERGEVTESCMANVVIDLDGRRLTPPAAAQAADPLARQTPGLARRLGRHGSGSLTRGGGWGCRLECHS
jgi:branched-subunit amino acid aminotransferase/4-amino-4-deoxychorismate lyase